jgi:hypothetical protein
VTDEAHPPREIPFGFLMRFALAMQVAFLVAVVAALGVTLASTPTDVRFLALAVVVPIIVLTVLCISMGLRRRVWGFVGAGVLGAVGVGLRLAISTQPGLEVGGGLPLWVTVLYVILGSMVSITSLTSALQLRIQPLRG